MNGFRIDADQLTRRAGELDELAGQAERIVDTLQQAVESGAQAWGSDEIGQSFAASHQPRSQQALDELGVMPGLLRDMGAKFAQTAATQQQVDQAGAEVLGSTTGQG